MLISGLIKKLSELKDQFGDVEVAVRNSYAEFDEVTDAYTPRSDLVAGKVVYIDTN